MKKSFLTSLLTIYLVIAFVATSSFYIIEPKKADANFLSGAASFAMNAAQCAGFDPLNWVKGKIGGLIGGAARGILGGTVPVGDDKTRAHTESIKTKENCLDGLAYEAAKLILGELNKAVKHWVENGFDGGNPAFALDIRQRVTAAVEIEFVRFLQGSEVLARTCGQDARQQVYRRLVQDFTSGYYGTGQTPATIDMPKLLEQRFESNAPCVLDYYTGGEEGSQDFLTGDLTKGGWQAYKRWITDPAANPVSSYIENSGRMVRDLASVAERAETQLASAGGYLPDMRCPQNAGGGKPRFGGVCTDANGKLVAPYIVTPPAAVQAIVNKMVESDQHRAELADELNELLSNLGQLFINHVLQKGLLKRAPGVQLLGPQIISDTTDPEDPIREAELCVEEAHRMADQMELSLYQFGMEIRAYPTYFSNPSCGSGCKEQRRKAEMSWQMVEQQIFGQIQGLGVLPTEANKIAKELVGTVVGGERYFWNETPLGDPLHWPHHPYGYPKTLPENGWAKKDTIEPLLVELKGCWRGAEPPLEPGDPDQPPPGIPPIPLPPLLDGPPPGTPPGSNDDENPACIEFPFEGRSEVRISGWAVDRDVIGTPLEIHIYRGPAGGPPVDFVTSIIADRNHQVTCEHFGSCNHGFEWIVPDQYIDGVARTFHTFAINAPNTPGDNFYLAGNPVNVQCSPPPPCIEPGCPDIPMDGVTLGGWTNRSISDYTYSFNFSITNTSATAKELDISVSADQYAFVMDETINGIPGNYMTTIPPGQSQTLTYSTSLNCFATGSQARVLRIRDRGTDTYIGSRSAMHSYNFSMPCF
jgi:hypothetical protein